jgi:methionyl-tRNA synthetase
VSRSGSGWGIPFPGDDSHRIYVWFDALTNYVTGAGFPGDEAAFARWWPADVHVIGKNITRFHCLYWPAMLMSAGLPLPRKVFAHGFMLMKGEKMSKTRGNVLDPDQALATFGVDGVRYLVLREIPFDRDGDVSADGMIRRYNADLANDLGNLVNRTVSMAGRYLDGTLPDLAGPDQAEADADLRSVAETAVADYRAAVEQLHFDEALLALSSLTRAANGYAESQAPWALHKSGNVARTGAVLATMGEACRILGHLLAPFCPEASAALLAQVGRPPAYDLRGSGSPGLDALLAWGAEAGERRTGTPAPLFPRIEDEA